MAVARAEIVPTSQNPFLFNLAADWIMKDLQNRLAYPLETDVKRRQEMVTAENKRLHEAARKLELALIPLAIAALAIVGWNNKDQIISALDLNGANRAPVPNVIIPPTTAIERRPTETLTPTRLPTFTLAPSETSTPEPTATEAPVEAWAPKTAAEYNAMIVQNNLKLKDWTGHEDGYAQFGWANVDVLDGLVGELTQVGGLTLLDYDSRAKSSDVLDLVFGYKYAGNTNYLLVRYNPCKPDNFYSPPSKPVSMNVGSKFIIELASASSIDKEVVVNTIGGGPLCQLYGDLVPVTSRELKNQLLTKPGGIHDLRSTTFVFNIRK